MSAVLKFENKSGEIISFNPATGEEIGRVENTSAEDVKAAVEDAGNAFQKWRKTSFDERKKIVMKAREVILAEMDEIALLISNESGKPVAEALSMEIAPVLDLMQYFAKNAEKLLKPRKVNIGLYGLMGRSSKIVYQPLGVVGIIPAWNYPFSIPLGETAMALMAGNTVVLKPSELTSFIGLKIGEIFEKAGIPENVVQIVTGAGETGAASGRICAGQNNVHGKRRHGQKNRRKRGEKFNFSCFRIGRQRPDDRFRRCQSRTRRRRCGLGRVL